MGIDTWGNTYGKGTFTCNNLSSKKVKLLSLKVKYFAVGWGKK